MPIHYVTGANLMDVCFEITLETGETVVWNVTELNRAAKAGAFGAVRYLSMADIPAAEWSNWTADDRARVDQIKTDPAVLDDPVIAIESEHPGFLLNCFADGQHRVTARQELGLAEVAFYLVPLGMERDFRIEEFDL